MKEYEYKLVLLGGSGIGAKTSLIKRFILNRFDSVMMTTSGANFCSTFIQVNLGIIRLGIWDTVGQKLYRKLSEVFIKNSHCIILGYDITSNDSFDEIKEFWYNYAKNIIGDESLIYLVANKIDLIRYEELSAREREGKNYAKEKGIKYFRISCKTGEGVDELFDITFFNKKI